MGTLWEPWDLETCYGLVRIQYLLQLWSKSSLAIGDLVNFSKVVKFKITKFKLNTCAPMTLNIQITKFKFR